MKKKPVTIYDIAQRLNLSPSTVSRALRNDHRINDNTKKLIGDTARAMNYQPNRVAAGLRGGSTATLGVIVPRIGRHFFSNAISGIEKVARSKGYQVIITQSNETVNVEQENVAALTAARVDGIIASVSIETVDAAHFAALSNRAFPMVFFDRVGGRLDTHRVVLDDFDSALRAVTHLIDNGATRIAHLGGPERNNVYRERYRGYESALREAGITLVQEYVVRDCLNEERGYEETGRLMSLPRPPDAIFCASDFPAIGVYKYCRGHAIKIPADLAIVGFANEPFTEIMEPGLTSVEQFGERMGATAAELLFRQIESRDEELPVEHIVIPGELKIRKSSLKLQSKTRN